MGKKIVVSAIILLAVFFCMKFLPGFNFVGQPDSSDQTENKALGPAPVSATPQGQALNHEAGGGKYAIEPASLLGLDKSIESAHFKIYFHSAHEEAALALITSAEKDYSDFSGFFEELPKTEILITNNADEYINVFNAAPPWGGEAYRDLHVSAGAFCPGCATALGDNTEYIYMLRPLSGKSFAHELSHRYFWTNYPSLRSDDYNWINEGLAVYVQNEISPGPGGFSSNNLFSLKNFTLPDNLVQLKELQEQGDYKSLERFYDLAGLLAIYISHKNKDYGLQDFLADLNNTENIEKTCQNKFTLDLSQLLKEWKTAVAQTVAENPTDFLDDFRKKIH